MVFSSLFFIFVFLPVTLLIYYCVPFSLKNGVLLLCSLVFYAWGEPVYVLLMMLNILFNYVMGLDIQLSLDSRSRVRAKLSLFAALAVNLGLLGFFKYYVFFVTNINAVFHTHIPCRDLGLPIGISFYTFQVLSYIIDIYKGKIRAQKNPVTLGAYVTMFPQLIAGPIVQYADVEKQLNSRQINLERFGQGMIIFIVGLAKKVLLANSMGAVFDTLSSMDTGSMAVLGGWLICISYTFQIYFDFSGYSDMAIGLGKMLGFDFKPNFNYPYTAKNASEFWRRWHISLSGWFRDYVYFPLGGSYTDTKRHIRNIMVVWMLTGLWHGAAWNFVIWGLYYGLILLFEKYFFLDFCERKHVPGIVMHGYTMLVVMIGWVIFSSESMVQCVHVLGVMFGFSSHPLADTVSMYYLTSNLILAGIMCCACTPAVKNFINRMEETYGSAVQRVMGAVYILLFIACIAYLVNETYNPFLYFRF